MGDALGKRVFDKSGAFRLALLYLAACAFALVWSEVHLAAQFREAWLFFRPPRLLLPPGNWKDWGPHEREMLSAYICERQRPAFCRDLLIQGYQATLVAVPVAAALGALARLVARARARAGQADPLAPVRAFAKRRPALSAAAPALMGLAYEMVCFVLDIAWDHRPPDLVSLALVAPPVFVVHLLLTRLGLPVVLAPTLEEGGETEKASVAENFSFAAVALTREARLAVKGLAVLTAALVAVLLAVPKFDHLAIDISVALYVPIAIFSALYFRRASRIAVGLDGIHVHGSSRSRFYAFHELDTVRTKGGSIELVCGDATVLRLQLHGPDAVRREPLTKRIAAAIAKAAEERDQPLTRFVNSATHEDLSRAAEGASSYRHAAVSRDQLWAAVEGPAVASGARIAAAKALATSNDAAERARFRIAADQCADPAARAELLDLLDDAPPARAERRAAS